MRFLTWNCRKGGGNKLRSILVERPDVALIQECSQAAMCDLPEGYSGLWLAGTQAVGMAVLFREPFSARRVDATAYPYFVSLDIQGSLTFRLIAVWNCREGSVGYDKRLHQFLDEHADWFEQSTILAGDLNSPTSATASVKSNQKFSARLGDMGLKDAYQAIHRHAPTKQPTCRQGKITPRYFHIDYVFVSAELSRKLSSVSIGDEALWSKWSDHFPVVVTLQDDPV